MSSKLMSWKWGKIGKQKNLSDFDSGKIIIARQLSRIISKIAGAVEYSRSVVVYKNFTME